MKRIIAIFIGLFMMLNHNTILAQNYFDKTEKANDILTKEQLKEIKRQAKDLKKEGWVAVCGDKGIEEQLTNYTKCKLNSDCIIGSSTKTATSYRLAYTAAHAKALSALASQIDSQLTSETQIILKNKQADDKTNSSSEFHNNIQSHSQEILADAYPVLVLTRQLTNGNHDVQVHLVIKMKLFGSNRH